MVVYVENNPTYRSINVESSQQKKKIVVSSVSNNQVVVQAGNDYHSVSISRAEYKNVYVKKPGGGLPVDDPNSDNSLLTGDADGKIYWSTPYSHPVFSSFDTDNPDTIVARIKTNTQGHVEIVETITKSELIKNLDIDGGTF